MDSILIQDVCEVYLKEYGVDSPKEYFYGLTTNGSVSQSINQESLRAGIGNSVVGVIQSEKELTFSVATLFHNDGVFEIQSGDEFKEITNFEVIDTLSGIAESATKITLSEKPQEGTIGAIVIIDSKGKKLSVTAQLDEEKTSVTGTGFTAGESYTVIFSRTAKANVLTLDSKKFPKNYKVQLHTIAYDVEKNSVVADIYWIFNKALPNGSLAGNYEAGTGNGNEVEFTAQLPLGSTEYGKYVVIPRNTVQA